MSTVRNLLLGSKRRRAMTLVAIAALFCVIALELTCQVVAFLQFRSMDRIKALPENYVRESTFPGMTYELRPGFDMTKPTTGRITVNKLGFREDGDGLFSDKQRIAIFGDSVALGVGVTQTETISAALQKELDPEVNSTKILNCGLLGLGMSEFPAFLRHVFQVYKPQTVVFILNPNDFVLRDSLYEGADGGMYRMYQRPFFKTPLCVRKAVYRMKKGGVSPSNSWYRWTFDGTKAVNLPKFKELQEICRNEGQGATFHVILMPIRGTFDTADKSIVDLYHEIETYLTENKIAWTNPAAAFAAAGATGNPQGDKLIDFTDHYTPDGSRVMAAAIKPIVEKK